MSERIFDDVAREAAAALLENFWIIRENQPEEYQNIRERENVLRTFFLEKMGFNLVIHRMFARIEKIPVEPAAWMGIQNFKSLKDYIIFCCILAYLEGKTVDEQFLLSDLCEELTALYPGEESLDWTHYEHRKSLVRVLQFVTELGLVKLIDGDIGEFNYSENSEALYEVPLISRYFLRAFPRDLTGLLRKEDFLRSAAGAEEDENTGVRRRHRVYRRLFLCPVMYAKGPEDPDYLYLRNYRNRIRDDVEKYSSFQFELFKNCAMLTLAENKKIYSIFPDNRAISDIALQFAGIIREEKEQEDIPLQYDGSLCLTPVDFERRVAHCKERYGAGWSKQYREASLQETVRDLLELLVDWQMAFRDESTGVITLRPLLARTVGRYPDDFKAGGEKDGAK